MQPELTPAVLASLRRPRHYPAVSVLVPTHRRKPDNAQDPIRLRNLLAGAAKELEADPAVTPSAARTSSSSWIWRSRRSTSTTPRTVW